MKLGVGVATGKKRDGSDAIQQFEMLVIPERDVYRLVMRYTRDMGSQKSCVVICIMDKSRFSSVVY